MKAVRREVGCFLRPISEWARDYRDTVLESLGFLQPLRDGARMIDAYSEAEQGFVIGERGRKIFASFCSAFGKGYRDDELRLADAHITELEEYVEQERRGVAKSCRLVSTLSAASSFAIVILLI